MVKILLDVKDENVFPVLEKFVDVVGRDRCIVHAFIKNWTIVPNGMTIDPHWHREEVNLFTLDELLSRLGVSCIVSCRGFSDAHVEDNQILCRMLKDGKQCKSVIGLGLYYPGAPIPKREFLEEIHRAEYYVWVNGNIPDFQEKIGNVRYIAMADDMKQCTRFVLVE